MILQTRLPYLLLAYWGHSFYICLNNFLTVKMHSEDFETDNFLPSIISPPEFFQSSNVAIEICADREIRADIFLPFIDWYLIIAKNNILIIQLYRSFTCLQRISSKGFITERKEHSFHFFCINFLAIGKRRETSDDSFLCSDEQ